MSDRRIAMLMILPFMKDTLTWAALFDALLEQDYTIKFDAAKAIDVLTEVGHRPPTWTCIAPAVHAILDGTNPSELHTVISILRTLQVGPEQAALFLKDGAHMLLAFASAKHPSYNQPAFRLLRLLSGQDFGSDVGRWRAWVRSL
jgi:hypothetical protein